MCKTLSVAAVILLIITASVSIGWSQQNQSKPQIVGQSPSPLTVNQGGSITIELTNLIVQDDDPSPVYPDGFSLEINSGENYLAEGTTVIPEEDFSGRLNVRVRVEAGRNKSDWFELQVDVIASSNQPPQIIGQSPLSMNQGGSFAIELGHLQVEDPDNNYPSGFQLTVYTGKNYSVNGTTTTPSPNFSGNLDVEVSVNDGENESNRFKLKVEVIKNQNQAPRITGQSPLSMNQGGSLTIQLGHLQVSDPDNNYPISFKLTVYTGKNYSVNGTTITPSPNFSGNLDVEVSVNDGENESNRFKLKVEVIKNQNQAPRITGQSPLSMNQGGSLTIQLGHLQVSDPDNNYPTGFELTVYTGNNYSVNGTTITPSANFSGNLNVEVSVNDGQNESKRYKLKIDVVKTQNQPPRIVGQTVLTMDQGGSLTIGLNHLQVSDPDNSYPADFTLIIHSGNNYAVTRNTITPSSDFSGNLTVQVSVKDKQTESNRFNLKIEVKKLEIVNPNKAPQITGQSPITINQGQRVTIALNHLIVTDPDNNYPEDFSLRVFSGNHYAVNGVTVLPNADFSGSLTVPVSVSDGHAESNRFELKIEVIKTSSVSNVAPRITGQEHLQINEDESFTLRVSNLRIEDPDNTFPQDFTLNIEPGANYTLSNATVTPTKNFSGTLSLNVFVSDGKNNSEFFNLQITVNPVNDPPVITGQVQLSTNENTILPITLSHLIVSDPDNTYPKEFSLLILPGKNYSFRDNLLSPATGFSGGLQVNVVVNDGKANSPEFKLNVNVLPVKPNVPPIIDGQKPISITQNTPLEIQLSHLLVTDPDDDYPQGFTLKVFSGSNYTVSEATITPLPNFTSGTLSVKVTVNDSKNESEPFMLKVLVAPITAIPRINGQKELTMSEDSVFTIALDDLVVTDADDPDYPNGFILNVFPISGNLYRVEGSVITPAKNYYGFIEVGVTVSDGKNVSEEYQVSILVIPVNDPPEILDLDNDPIVYEPGSEPIPLFESADLRDVDDEYLIMLDIELDSANYRPANDEIVVEHENPNIRLVRDTKNVLHLIGFASVGEYREILRSIKYRYTITTDGYGNHSEILSGPRTVYVRIYDATLASSTYERKLNMKVEVVLDIPNAFTPDGDQENDTWHLQVTNTDQVDNAIIRVYDKRGLLLYEAAGFDKMWDGIYNGEVLPVDTYFYTIDLKLPYTKKTYKGTITLLR
jgi:gliding motility-associated-like protein